VKSKQDIMQAESMFDSMLCELEGLASDHADFPKDFSKKVRNAQTELHIWMKTHGMEDVGGEPTNGKENWWN